MTHFLEYNDWQLRLFNDTGSEAYADLAAASTVSGNLEFGLSAWQNSRISPQQFNARYLSALNAEPIKGDMRPAQNQADLIYHQLLAIQKDSSALTETAMPIVAAIPGYLSDEQLGLFMGIASQAKLNIRGFIDLGLAYAVGHATSTDETTTLPETFTVLDIELNRLVASEFRNAQPTLSLTQARHIDGSGLSHILDGWMNLVADEFVHTTRFDPMHTGACEQQLQDHIFSWITEGRIAPRVNIEHNNLPRAVEIRMDQAEAKLQQRLESAFSQLQHAPEALYLTPRVNRIPGLANALRNALGNKGIHIEFIDDKALQIGLQYAATSLPEDDIIRVSEVPLTQIGTTNPSSAAPQPPTTSGKDGTSTSNPTQSLPATHLLNEHKAIAIYDPRFDELFESLIKQGRITTRESLSVGEVVEHNGQQLIAILVE